jgi:hypothetical protein
MPNYVILMKLTDQGAKTIKDAPGRVAYLFVFRLRSITNTFFPNQEPLFNLKVGTLCRNILVLQLSISRCDLMGPGPVW